MDKTYTNMVTYFNTRQAEIEDFEASQPNVTKEHGVASANAVRELAIVKLLEQLVKRDEEKAAAAIKVNTTIEKLGEVLLNVNKRLDREETSIM